MPIPAGSDQTLYVDTDTLARALKIENPSETDDQLLTWAAGSASRHIDRLCGRRFYRTTEVATRTFRTTGRTVGGVLLVDDIAALEGLIVEPGSSGSYVATSDYFTGPENALDRGWPITELTLDVGSWAGARITAYWGWPTVPDEIGQASMIQAIRLFKRKDSPEGVLGNSEWGVARVTRVDPDVQALITPYMKPAFA